MSEQIPEALGLDLVRITAISLECENLHLPLENRRSKCLRLNTRLPDEGR